VAASAHTHSDETSRQDWADHAANRLADAGYRRGGARQAIIDLLAAQRCALSAFEIERVLEDGNRRVARASVYRVLDELVTLELVLRLEVGQGIARYEVVDPNGRHHHHHMVCSDCGDVLPFEDEELERTLDRVAERVTFKVADHEITLHGACGRCQR
jgi:Fur family ferric uptake transcriptional regulator